MRVIELKSLEIYDKVFEVVISHGSGIAVFGSTILKGLLKNLKGITNFNTKDLDILCQKDPNKVLQSFLYKQELTYRHRKSIEGHAILYRSYDVDIIYTNGQTFQEYTLENDLNILQSYGQYVNNHWDIFLTEECYEGINNLEVKLLSNNGKRSKERLISYKDRFNLMIERL